jgi:hypothetical protein
MADHKSDTDFIQDLLRPQLFKEFGEYNGDINKNVVRDFFEEYKKWRESTCTQNIKSILPSPLLTKELDDKLTQECRKEKQKIEEDEFARICNEIENMYNDG